MVDLNYNEFEVTRRIRKAFACAEEARLIRQSRSGSVYSKPKAGPTPNSGSWSLKRLVDYIGHAAS
jgi:hypothetical protein